MAAYALAADERRYARRMISEPLVIGAGPAGLAVAATLARDGQRCVVLERADSVGASWQGRYDSLRLHTARWLSGLPGGSIPRQYGRWVARDDFVAYLRDYAERFGVRPEFGVDVRRIERIGGGWRIESSRGGLSASTVVVATGYSRVPYLPDWPGRDTFTGTLVHSSAYREPSEYPGRQVLVVGAGNSAAEIAVDLAKAGARVDLSVRTPPNIVRRDTLGVPSQLFGIALKHVPERVMNPLSTMLRRVSVPDLSLTGCPRRQATRSRSSCARARYRSSTTASWTRSARAGSGSWRRWRAWTATPSGWSTARPCTRTPSSPPPATGRGWNRWWGICGVLDERGLPLVHGPQTLPELPGLYFVGITIQLAGLLSEIGLEAQAVGDAVARHPYV